MLTRPDRPRGRGRRLGAPPAKEAAERLGVPVLQPEQLGPDIELDADVIVVAAYGLLIPEALLERALWLNFHPSLLPRWRGAAPVERAIMAGDRETGVTIHETVKELDAGPIAAQRAFPIGPEDDAGAVYARAAEVGADLLAEVLPGATFRPQPEEGVTYAAKIAPEDRVLDWSRPPQESLDRIRALSPHIGARGELHGQARDGLARRGRRRRAPAARGAAGGRAADGLRRVRPRRAVTISPARRAAFEVVRRVFEDDAYADRAFRSRRGGPRRARPRARAAARLRDGAARAHARPRDRDARAPARCASSTRRCARRSGSRPTSSATSRASRGTPPSTSRSSSCARPASRARSRSRTRSRAGSRTGSRPLLAALPEGTPAEAALRHSYPDWVAEVWWRDLGREGALALMRAQNEPPRDGRAPRPRHDRGRAGSRDPGRVARRPGRRARRSPRGRIWPQSRGSQLAALAVGSAPGERVLDLCAAPGGKATALAGEVTAVEVHPGRARELEENARASAPRTSASSRPTGSTCRRSSTASTARSSTRPARASACSPRGPDLRWRAAPLPELQLALLQAAAARVRPGGTVVYAVCTPNADENEAVVDASGLEVEPLGDEWPQFRHPRRPEFLLTLPHVHGTSGFFIARLRRTG